MWHLFKHLNGEYKNKYDVAFVKKGKYGAGSKQGYNKKKDAVTLLVSMGAIFYQDDTTAKPTVIQIFRKEIPIDAPFPKPAKPYQPSTTKAKTK